MALIHVEVERVRSLRLKTSDLGRKDVPESGMGRQEGRVDVESQRRTIC